MDTGIASLSETTLDSCLTEHDRPVLMSGIQALVRVLLEQSLLDRAAGLRTEGFVSGYRGSPLGGLDQALWRDEKLLTAAGVKFQPGLNEDLAATMLWGTQQLDAFPGARVDGVFGMWYGKGPGVDRSGDALRAANIMGTSARGGVLAVSGDDHGAHSSTYPHQTEQVFEGAMIPVLVPSSAGEIVDLGLAGIALSRVSGLWAALKTTAEIAEQAATVIVPSARSFVTPELPGLAHPRGFDAGLKHPRDRAELERRLYEDRLPAALAFARANHLDRLMHGDARADIGIVTVGKAHQDAMHALTLLGLRRSPEIAVFKIALAWPLEPEGLRNFARGKKLLIVIEEKRGFVETQIRDALYNMPADSRPPVVGKSDLSGAPLFTPLLELTPEISASALARTLRPAGVDVAVPAAAMAAAQRDPGLLTRAPAFCAGCPHSTSTRLPDGSYAMAGIGCHFMVLDDAGGMTRTFTHMGGEGVTWAGLAPFTDLPHMFINLGDGTYQHSGSLAIRQAVAAKTRVTYKILYNDAVAMTGGQPAESAFSPLQIIQQVAAEGVSRIAIVADDISRIPPASALPPGVERHGREDLDAVQRAFREHEGVSVILYDQVCATEKRRRRKRGKLAESEVSVLIDTNVCEGCGDCGVQSQCIAIEPAETALGRKRRINPTACNVDLSCLKGFCPSFVTVAGPPRAPAADPRWAAREATLAAELPLPARDPGATVAWRGMFAGIGGGGVVTTGAIVAMAAHLDGLAVSTLDFTGLAQKNGAVVSHVQIARDPAELDVVRIPLGAADLMLAPDLAVASMGEQLERCGTATSVIGNLDLVAGSGFKTDGRLSVDAGLHRRVIERGSDRAHSTYLHAARLAERLFGNAQAMNTMLLGIAWQRGLVPVSLAALDRAIELNGAALKVNRRAFLWGRALANDPSLADAVLADEPAEAPPASLDALIDQRAALLDAYDGERTAEKYRARVADVARREAAALGASGSLARTAAEGWFRVMYHKDEAEVARLHLLATYDPARKPVFHLAPPLVTGIDPATGRRRKIAIPGRIALPVFRVLRAMRRLRGTALDPFAWQAERRAERGWADAYAADLDRALTALRPATLDTARRIADLPDIVRGYGPVRAANWERMQGTRAELLGRLDLRPAMPVAAE